MLAALLRQQQLNRSSIVSSGLKRIFWAVLITLCSALLSATEQLPKYVAVLSKHSCNCEEAPSGRVWTVFVMVLIFF